MKPESIQIHEFPAMGEDLEKFIYEGNGRTHSDRADYTYMAEEAPCDKCDFRSVCFGKCPAFMSYEKNGTWDASKRPSK